MREVERSRSGRLRRVLRSPVRHETIEVNTSTPEPTASSTTGSFPSFLVDPSDTSTSSNTELCSSVRSLLRPRVQFSLVFVTILSYLRRVHQTPRACLVEGPTSSHVECGSSTWFKPVSSFPYPSHEVRRRCRSGSDPPSSLGPSHPSDSSRTDLSCPPQTPLDLVPPRSRVCTSRNGRTSPLT